MAITECGICGENVRETEMKFFSQTGEVCPKCLSNDKIRELLKSSDELEADLRDIKKELDELEKIIGWKFWHIPKLRKIKKQYQEAEKYWEESKKVRKK